MPKEQLSGIVALLGTTNSGKSTFAERLGAELNGVVLKETTEGNLFMADAHNPAGRIFQNQAWFLLQSSVRWEKAAQLATEGKLAIMDTFVPKNLIHSKLTLDSDSYTLYERLADRLTAHLPLPNVVVYLFDSPDFILGRLKARGKFYDASVQIDHIERMNTLHELWISEAQLPTVRIRSRSLEDPAKQKQYIFEIGAILKIQ
jgi:deoxyguanosine kinase